MSSVVWQVAPAAQGQLRLSDQVLCTWHTLPFIGTWPILPFIGTWHTSVTERSGTSKHRPGQDDFLFVDSILLPHSRTGRSNVFVLHQNEGNIFLFRMSEVDQPSMDGEERLLGKRDVEEDPRFNTLFSRLELEDR